MVIISFAIRLRFSRACFIMCLCVLKLPYAFLNTFEGEVLDESI